MTNSQFFRDALANKELEPIAASIKEKASHHQKDSTFVYPLWQLQNDISALKAKAKQFGTSENYPDDLIQHMKESPQTDGFLICYYQSYSGFMLQWLLIGSIVLMAVYFSTSKKIGPKIERWEDFQGDWPSSCYYCSQRLGICISTSLSTIHLLVAAWLCFLFLHSDRHFAQQEVIRLFHFGHSHIEAG